MLLVCRRYTKSLEDAEEVLANGFIKIFKQMDQYQGKGPFEAWMRRIMVNESINFIRYQKNLFVEWTDQVASTHNEENLGDDGVQELLHLIDELPMGYRTVFNLYAIEGYPHKEIAEMLGISESTSKSQLNRARKSLQDRILEQRKQMES